MVLVSAVGVTDALISPVEVLPRTSWSLACGRDRRFALLGVEGDHALAVEVEDQRGFLVALRHVHPHPVALDAGRLRAAQVADHGTFPLVVAVTVTSAAAGAATRQASTKAKSGRSHGESSEGQ